mgnify:CR=1 FL=1
MGRTLNKRQRKIQAMAWALVVKRLCWVLLLCGGMTLVKPLACLGQEQREQKDRELNGVFTNPDTGYQVWVEDEANLLSEEQLLELSQIMQAITEYGNVAFVSVRSNRRSTEDFARSYYKDRFGADSGTVFVIDMDHRNIWIHSDGAIYQAVTSAYANTITDNVYRYASKGDYFGCAREAFQEIDAVLKGNRIAQPMKYISNALLAMLLALLINFGLIIWFTRLQKPRDQTILGSISRTFRYSKLRATHTFQTKVYDPASGGSGGRSGGGGGGGGRSGGGRSGGGGGHSF